jgi:hypothetical protein
MESLAEATPESTVSEAVLDTPSYALGRSTKAVRLDWTREEVILAMDF